MRRQDSDLTTIQARIPVELCCPVERVWHLTQVLEGEYESGYVGGEGLKVLDIGANAGAFSIWAAHRWPGSSIEAYEPHPGTFQLLQVNTRSYPMIRCHNLAVYPSTSGKVPFTSRYVGDGEAGIVEALADTFRQNDSDSREFFQVPTLHPRELPSADIVKIDVEGSEADIVKHANFTSASLLLIEYQYLRNLNLIKAQLTSEFETILEDKFSYAEIMVRNTPYKQSLANDYYGHLFLLRRGQTRLRRLQPPIVQCRPSQLRVIVKSLLPPALVNILKKARDGLR
jgi:FkbM family methyltransferase